MVIIMLLKAIKKICFALVVIYSLNLLIMNLSVFVPINYFTIIVVSLLGFPGLITLAISFFFLM